VPRDAVYFPKRVWWFWVPLLKPASVWSPFVICMYVGQVLGTHPSQRIHSNSTCCYHKQPMIHRILWEDLRIRYCEIINVRCLTFFFLEVHLTSDHFRESIQGHYSQPIGNDTTCPANLCLDMVSRSRPLVHCSVRKAGIREWEYSQECFRIKD
jgi:hypothetical protein